VPVYKDLLFQQFKRRPSFGKSEPLLSDPGETFVYKRHVLKSIKIADPEQEKKQAKKEAE